MCVCTVYIFAHTLKLKFIATEASSSFLGGSTCAQWTSILCTMDSLFPLYTAQSQSSRAVTHFHCIGSVLWLRALIWGCKNFPFYTYIPNFRWKKIIGPVNFNLKFYCLIFGAKSWSAGSTDISRHLVSSMVMSLCCSQQPLFILVSGFQAAAQQWHTSSIGLRSGEVIVSLSKC